MLSFNKRFLSMRAWITTGLGSLVTPSLFAPYVKAIIDSSQAPYGKTPQRPGAYGTRCFSPDCDCDPQPGSCRNMPRGETLPQPRWRAKRPIGKRAELAAPYGKPYVAVDVCRWPGECKCYERMGNDFFFLPLDKCIS